MTIIEIPAINGLGKTPGVESAPKKILEELKEICSNSSNHPINHKNIKSETINVKNNIPEEDNKLIYESALNLFTEKSKPLFLGGDHSLSYSTTRAFFDHCDTSKLEPCLIVFDAHPDLMQPVDAKFPTHEEWLNQLIKDGFPTKNILLIGCRNADEKELEFIKKHNIRQISIDKIQENLEETAHIIMEFSRHKELYISIDIDVIDPAFAPATYYTETGGLSSSQFIYVISRMSRMKNLRAIDIVEINPEKDTDKKITLKLGAKILSEFL